MYGRLKLAPEPNFFPPAAVLQPPGTILVDPPTFGPSFLKLFLFVGSGPLLRKLR